jgi:hypothetical protein
MFILLCPVEVIMTSFTIAVYMQEGQKGVSAITTSQNSRIQEYFSEFVIIIYYLPENSISH